MTQYHRAPREDIVNIRLPILIIELAALGAFDKEGVSFYGTKSTDGTVDSSGKELQCFLE